MGKRQHQKDKLYLTTTEWSTIYGGRRPNATRQAEGSEFKRLPKYGIDPASGKPIDAKKLIRLNFVKNADGKYHCPVLYKVFNENTHIVAIKTTGNVFSYDACRPPEPQGQELQGPADGRTVYETGHHHASGPERPGEHNLKVIDPEEERMKSDPKYTLRKMNAETRTILDTLDKEYKPPAEKTEKVVKKADKFNAAHYSTGAVAASSRPPTSQAVLADDVVRYSMVKKKGYVQLQTTHGNLNFELYCDAVPKTCENFVGLCKKGYYDNTKFHRSIRHFMIQGGDPTGTGKGGDSLWGKPFKDEFKPNLLVGGLDALNTIEAVETDNKDRPIEDIVILKAVVFVDPFEEVNEELKKKREEEETKKKRGDSEEMEKKLKAKRVLKEFHKGVGKYIDPAETAKVASEAAEAEAPAKKVKAVTGKFGDFSCW
ncbi:hypothetical protein HPB52_014386 [Rhipicephalus sanguineus]|uniref:PPIase cyclophilin-type domain-containing protein n=1 Tax=Rhipicephalus sanguineus TaxID=34632 RepID=A0A9D4QER9_RHISA|nr:hypothetical protein HPB52_014386 [Rhipicephalus sanguineus]